jgi:hypothetical protein
MDESAKDKETEEAKQAFIKMKTYKAVMEISESVMNNIPDGAPPIVMAEILFSAAVSVQLNKQARAAMMELHNGNLPVPGSAEESRALTGQYEKIIKAQQTTGVAAKNGRAIAEAFVALGKTFIEAPPQMVRDCLSTMRASALDGIEEKATDRLVRAMTPEQSGFNKL